MKLVILLIWWVGISEEQGTRTYPSPAALANRDRPVNIRMLSYPTPSYLQAQYFSGQYSVRPSGSYIHFWYVLQTSEDGHLLYQFRQTNYDEQCLEFECPAGYMKTGSCNGTTAQTNHTKWTVHTFDNNVFWLSSYYYGNMGADLVELPLEYYFDEDESKYMLGVNDPDASWYPSREFNGTAYFILEDLEFHEPPWFLDPASNYCIKVNNRKYLRTLSATDPNYLTNVTADDGIYDCNEATPTRYFWKLSDQYGTYFSHYKTYIQSAANSYYLFFDSEEPWGLQEDEYYIKLLAKKNEYFEFTDLYAMGPGSGNLFEIAANGYPSLTESYWYLIVAQKCDPKRYKNAGVCAACHYSCQECYGTFTNCTDCNTDNDQYLAFDGTCRCPETNYFIDTDAICKICHSSCETCMGMNRDNCVTCSAALHRVMYSPAAGQQMCICEEGYFQFEEYNLSNCVRAVNCPQSKVGILADDNDLDPTVKGNICYQECLHSKCVMLETNVCSGECHVSCAQCLYPSDDSYCTKCADSGTFLSNPTFGSCVHSVSRCDPTYVGVKTVDSLGNEQLSCQYSCPGGQAVNDDLNSVNYNLCEDCYKNCKTCFRPNDEFACIDCKDTTYLSTYNNTFVWGYPYEILRECLECEANSYLSKGECVSECPSGTYQEALRRQCVKCTDYNCIKCTTAEYCIDCRTLYLAVDGICVKNDSCSSSLYIKRSGNTFICDWPCGSEYFTNEKYRICQICHSSCKTCSAGNSAIECTSCYSNYYFVSSTGECVEECPDSYYAYRTETSSDWRCLQCSLGCAACTVPSSSKNCTRCIYQYYLFDNCSCTAQCPSGYFAEQQSQSCLQCDSTCLECNGIGESDCVSCNSSRLFSNFNYDESGYCFRFDIFHLFIFLKAFQEKAALFAEQRNISLLIANATSVPDLFQVALDSLQNSYNRQPKNSKEFIAA